MRLLLLLLLLLFIFIIIIIIIENYQRSNPSPVMAEQEFTDF